MYFHSGNVNIVHMVQFVEAEIAALGGDDVAALKLYVSSISSSARIGCLPDRAAAHERAALLLLKLSNVDEAVHHLTSAVRIHRYWGATAKVDQILKLHGHNIPNRVFMEPLDSF